MSAADTLGPGPVFSGPWTADSLRRSTCFFIFRTRPQDYKGRSVCGSWPRVIRGPARRRSHYYWTTCGGVVCPRTRVETKDSGTGVAPVHKSAHDPKFDANHVDSAASARNMRSAAP